MNQHSRAFVGIDTSKLRNAVAVAEDGRDGDVRYLGEIDTTEAATRKLVLRSCYRRRVPTRLPARFLPQSTDAISLSARSCPRVFRSHRRQLGFSVARERHASAWLPQRSAVRASGPPSSLCDLRSVGDSPSRSARPRDCAS